MKIGDVLRGVFVILLVLPMISSAVIIEDDFRSVYSVGDRVDLDFSVSSNNEVSDFVTSYLVCDNDRELIDKRYVFLNDESKDFELEFPVMNDGECRFEVEFRNDEDESEEFEISDEVEIEFELNDKSFFPGEKVLVNGSAEKANGEDYEGIVEFSISGLVDRKIEVDNGRFSFEYVILDEAAPKDYDLEVSCSEKDSDDNVLNSGRLSEKIEVKSKATSISIASIDHFKPGYNLTVNVKLLDQVNDLMVDEGIILKVLDYDGNLFFEKEVVSNIPEVVNFPSNFKRGSLSLNAYYGGIKKSIPVYVEDNKEVNSEIVGNYLRFRNIGNVLYEGLVDFELVGEEGVEEILVNVTIPVGGYYDYKLEYTGTYNITSEGVSHFNVPLTGFAVSSSGDINWSSMIVFSIFCLFLIFGYIHVRRKRKEHFPPKEKVEGSPEMVSKIEREIKTRQIYVKEEEEKKVEVKRDVYMLFIKSTNGVEEYSGIIEKYGSRLHVVDDELGYVVFYGVDGVDSDHKLYKLAKNIKKFSNIKEDKVSIVLNKGYFEKKISLLKKFALINKKLLLMFPHKVVVGDKLMERVGGHSNFSERIVEVDSRKMRVWVI